MAFETNVTELAVPFFSYFILSSSLSSWFSHFAGLVMKKMLNMLPCEGYVSYHIAFSYLNFSPIVAGSGYL
jgi:hypothetical protein